MISGRLWPPYLGVREGAYGLLTNCIPRHPLGMGVRVRVRGVGGVGQNIVGASVGLEWD